MTDVMGKWPETIPSAAQEAAQKLTNQTALIEGENRWTFAELWRDARATASAFIESGLKAGDRVSVWGPNCRNWILVSLGAQICGAAIVPLNTRFKAIEAVDLITRSYSKFVFCSTRFRNVDHRAMIADKPMPDLQEIVSMDAEFDAFVARGKGADDPRVDAAMAALTGDVVSDIIFTSGTTGAPKGAITTHRQVTQTFGDWATRVDLRQGDNYLIVNPFFHTFGYKAGWVGCLVRGCTIVPMPIFDVQECIRMIEHYKINFIPGPPTIYQSLLAEIGTGKKFDFSSLRVAVTGAAPVPPAMVERMRKELGMQNIVNGYGMTECGVICMTCQGDDAETIAYTCGKALPGVEMKIVDDNGADLPPNSTGEIWVRSQAVTKGYLDDPEATAKAIDPQGWLHTGDVGSLDERGYLKITDRKKDMYISGGFNCYPAEIEKLLQAHPAIEVAAVIGVPDERMGEVGKAYVILRPNAKADAPEIIAWARENMANYKVPKSIEFVADLPRNAGGKVLRDELRAMASKH